MVKKTNSNVQIKRIFLRKKIQLKTKLWISSVFYQNITLRGKIKLYPHAQTKWKKT